VVVGARVIKVLAINPAVRVVQVLSFFDTPAPFNISLVAQ
jgi:hypothetical protein